jgi:hypothetical protein
MISKVNKILDYSQLKNKNHFKFSQNFADNSSGNSDGQETYDAFTDEAELKFYQRASQSVENTLILNEAKQQLEHMGLEPEALLALIDMMKEVNELAGMRPDRRPVDMGRFVDRDV